MIKKTQKTNHISVRKNSTKGLLGLVFVALFTVAAALPSSYAADSKDTGCKKESAACTNKAEIPREWNWKKADINFDHMYPSDK